jgi:PAS domain S-box-containing protein
MNYFEELNGAVTVCDTQGNIVYRNRKSQQTFAAHGELTGKNLRDCHPPKAWEKIQQLLATGESNTYTIEKNGQKKLIHQTPWFENGELKGLIEFSFVIPFEMPHFLRS